MELEQGSAAGALALLKIHFQEFVFSALKFAPHLSGQPQPQTHIQIQVQKKTEFSR
jgi:hypothetical protein